MSGKTHIFFHVGEYSHIFSCLGILASFLMSGPPACHKTESDIDKEIGDEAGHANTAHTVRKLLGAGLIAPELTLLTEGWQLDGRLREISQLKL